jgi:hypothetical protein
MAVSWRGMEYVELCMGSSVANGELYVLARRLD